MALAHLLALLPVAFAEASPTAVHIMAVSELDGTAWTQVTLTGGGADCELLAEDAAATLDGVALAVKSRGHPLGPLRVSGIELPQQGCAPAYLLGPRMPHRAEPSRLGVTHGGRRIEVEVAALRAEHALVGSGPARSGARLTLSVTPAAGPPLVCPPGTEVSVYQGDRRVAAVRALRFEGRKVSFTLPELAPGRVQIVLQCSGGGLEVSRCAGATTCEATYGAAPDGVTLEVAPG